MNISRKKLIILIVLIAFAGFAGGFWFSSYNSADPIKILINRDVQPYKNIDFSLFWKVWDKLNEKYVDGKQLDPEEMLYGAIEGMVSGAGDPYTVFFRPTDSKKFQEEISGSFGGIGIEIGKRNGALTVIAPIKGTPAEKAGLMAGDKILKIDSKLTNDLSIDEAVKLIRGKPGTRVILTISKKAGEAVEDVTIQRETIKVPTSELTFIDSGGKKIAYLRLFSFNQNIDSDFRKAAQEITQQNADGLILDLRNNPGGLLDSAVNISGWFLDKDKTVTIEDFGDGVRNELKTSGNSLLRSLPVVVLINGGSASASEILAGALHDNRGVKLVGEKTFGKGSVQELEKFSDGSSLKVTVAKWLTPSGISISEKGIEPDVKVEIPTDEKEQEKIEIGQPGKDPQLDKAIELLK